MRSCSPFSQQEHALGFRSVSEARPVSLYLLSRAWRLPARSLARSNVAGRVATGAAGPSGSQRGASPNRVPRWRRRGRCACASEKEPRANTRNAGAHEQKANPWSCRLLTDSGMMTAMWLRHRSSVPKGAADRAIDVPAVHARRLAYLAIETRILESISRQAAAWVCSLWLCSRRSSLRLFHSGLPAFSPLIHPPHNVATTLHAPETLGRSAARHGLVHDALAMADASAETSSLHTNNIMTYQGP